MKILYEMAYDKKKGESLVKGLSDTIRRHFDTKMKEYGR